MIQLEGESERGRGRWRSRNRRIPLEEAFAVVGWTAVAISSITAPPPAAAATRSPRGAMETFPGAAITLRAPGASRAGRQQSVAFSWAEAIGAGSRADRVRSLRLRLAGSHDLTYSRPPPPRASPLPLFRSLLVRTCASRGSAGSGQGLEEGAFSSREARRKGGKRAEGGASPGPGGGGGGGCGGKRRGEVWVFCRARQQGITCIYKRRGERWPCDMGGWVGFKILPGFSLSKY